MIRPAALLLLVLIAGAVGAVFFVSYEVRALDDQLDALNAQIEADYQALHVLDAEWSYLNQPQLLAALAERYLDLAPLQGRQLAQSENVRRDRAPAYMAGGVPGGHRPTDIIADGNAGAPTRTAIAPQAQTPAPQPRTPAPVKLAATQTPTPHIPQAMIDQITASSAAASTATATAPDTRAPDQLDELLAHIIALVHDQSEGSR